MKFAVTLAAALLMGTASFAQTATGTGTATANSGSSSSANAGAIAHSGGGAGGQAQQSQGQYLYLDQRTPGEVRSTTTSNVNVNERQSGTVRNEFAPAVSAPAMGSGHPCGMGNSLGISIIGGGATGGITRVDDACLLAQMGKTTAAMAMIAARSPAACAALVASGDISPDSNCGDGTRSRGGIMRGGSSAGPATRAPNGQPMAVGQRPVSAGNVSPALAVASKGPVCRIGATPRTVVTSATTQQGRMACAASLGLR